MHRHVLEKSGIYMDIVCMNVECLCRPSQTRCFPRPCPSQLCQTPTQPNIILKGNHNLLQLESYFCSFGHCCYLLYLYYIYIYHIMVYQGNHLDLEFIPKALTYHLKHGRSTLDSKDVFLTMMDVCSEQFG